MALDVSGRGVVAAPAASVFPALADLSTYTQWMGIVHAVEVVPNEGEEPAWSVELGARLGPFRRTKRVRMVRTSLVPGTSAVFERAEVDGKEHPTWVLKASIVPVGPAASDVTMDLHYGGQLWVPGLELMLREEVRRAPGRLLRVVSG